MSDIQKLIKEISLHYKKAGRSHLPWRRTRDTYKILVSEIMLQQTQVERVIPYYKNFLTKFPTARALARAKLPQVLKAWQGLGYNRRAKYLHEAAKRLAAAEFPKKGEMNGSPTAFLGNSVQLPIAFLESLRGVGPYTARAVAAFAYNKPEVFIETNIRTVFLHFCFGRPQKNPLRRREVCLSKARGFSAVADADILPLVAEALKKSKMQPRDFYAALMDYGAYLKQNGVKLNSRSKHYIKQSKFEGSARQLRGAILRELLKKPATPAQLTKNLSRKSEEVEREIVCMKAEGLLAQRAKRVSIAV